MSSWPPCGLYRTTQPLDSHIPAGRLVYFHNHGEPGPGIYLPKGWNLNRAEWQAQGHVLPNVEWALTLKAMPAEGLYRVSEAFFCCSKRCRQFDADMLVQLGYNGSAEPILFVPEFTNAGMAFPEHGSSLDPINLSRLSALKVVESRLPNQGPLH